MKCALKTVRNMIFFPNLISLCVSDRIMAAIGRFSAHDVHKRETTRATLPHYRSIKSTIPKAEFGLGTCDSDYRQQTWSGMGRLFQQETLSDVMLMAEGRSIPCHKFLLAAASEYFYNRLVLEVETDNHNQLEIEGISFSTLKVIVSYLYTGNINITAENAKEVIPACKMLKLTSACDTCETFALETVTAANCIGLYKMAMAHGVQQLSTKAFDVMMNNFNEVVSGREFLSMSEAGVADYIKNENLKIPNEEPVFAAVVSWVRHQPHEREYSLSRLIKHVRLRYCSPHYLTQVVSKEPLMDNHECQRLLVAAFKHQSSGNIPTPQPYDSRKQSGAAPREGYAKTTAMMIMGGFSDPGRIDRTDCWRLDQSGWRVVEQCPIPIAMRFFAACVMKKEVIVTGGRSNCKSVSRCWLLSTSTYQWSSLPDLNTARARHASVCVEGKAYVIAGEDSDDKAMASVECLDIFSQKWETLRELPKALEHPMAVSHRECIYVFGGIDMKDNYSPSVFVYDTRTKSWKTLADIPEMCKFGSAVVWKDRIHIVGGFEQACMCYDPVLAQWSTLSQCRHEHADGPALVWKDRILVCGGRSNKAKGDDSEAGATSVVEEYNTVSDNWTVAQIELPQKLCLHFVFAIEANMSVYVR